MPNTEKPVVNGKSQPLKNKNLRVKRKMCIYLWSGFPFVRHVSTVMWVLFLYPTFLWLIVYAKCLECTHECTLNSTFKYQIHLEMRTSDSSWGCNNRRSASNTQLLEDVWNWCLIVDLIIMQYFVVHVFFIIWTHKHIYK